MSRTPLPFAPDPTKWIDTSKSSSRSKPKPQRPLAGWKNPMNMATPPSTLRRPALKGKPSEYNTPVPRQVGLTGYLTPPTTGPGIRPRGLDRLRQEVEKELGTPLVSKSSATQRVDDFWGSSSDGEAGPSKPTVLQREGRPKKPQVYIDPEDDEREEAPIPDRSQRKPMVVGRSPRRLGPTTSQQIIRSSQIALNRTPPKSRKRSRTPEIIHSPGPLPALSSSSPPARTPIPAHILQLHRNLCGQGTAQLKRTRFPRRADRPIPSHSSPVPQPKSPIMDVENRALLLKDKRKKEQENTTKLVTLSSSDTDQDEENRKKKAHEESGVLRSFRVNSRDKAFVSDFASPPRKLRKTTSMLGTDSSHRIADTNADHRSLSPSRRPAATIDAGIPPRHACSPNKGPDQPDLAPLSDQCIELSSPLTPRNATPKKITPQHHKVTPPKDKSSKRTQGHAETLLVFPPPLPQPDFGQIADPTPTKREWQPVEMHAETLLTWSLGGGARSDSSKAIPLAQLSGADERAPRESDSSVHRPDPTPIQSGKRKRTTSASPATESLAASMPSESFPNFVHSSPSKRSAGASRSDQTLPRPAIFTELAGDFPMPPSRQPSTSLTSPRGRSAKRPAQTDADDIFTTPLERSAPPSASKSAADRWKSLKTGILSVPPPSADKTPGSAKSTRSRGKNRKSRTPAKEDRTSQPKLAAFGFFPEDETPMSGSLHETFDNKWEEEPDLELEELDVGNTVERDADCRDDDGDLAGPAEGPKRLGAVPEAPPHPDLRPAGIAELARRERLREDIWSQRRAEEDAKKEEVLLPSGPSGEVVSSDPSSDLSSSDPLFPEEEGRTARDWLEGISHRRSSEFGSFRSEL